MEHFFGYGSLVNRGTHSYPGGRPARLAGWRRLWVHVPAFPYGYLSAEPAPGVSIDGLVAEVPGGDWAALDRREASYRRHAVQADTVPGALAAHVYAAPPDLAVMPGPAHPVLLSYIDAVVQGFLREWGEEGVERFFATTAGWEAPILNDRAAPRYPRPQRLEPAEAALADEGLARVGARIMA